MVCPACCSRRGRPDTALGLVHIDAGLRGRHIPGADIPAAVPPGRRVRSSRPEPSRRQRLLRPVLVEAVRGRCHAGDRRNRLRYRHVRQLRRAVRRVPSHHVSGVSVVGGKSPSDRTPTPIYHKGAQVREAAGF